MTLILNYSTSTYEGGEYQIKNEIQWVFTEEILFYTIISKNPTFQTKIKQDFFSKFSKVAFLFVDLKRKVYRGWGPHFINHKFTTLTGV